MHPALNIHFCLLCYRIRTSTRPECTTTPPPPPLCPFHQHVYLHRCMYTQCRDTTRETPTLQEDRAHFNFLPHFFHRDFVEKFSSPFWKRKYVLDTSFPIETFSTAPSFDISDRNRNNKKKIYIYIQVNK